jgi:hypothetical protein
LAVLAICLNASSVTVNSFKSCMVSLPKIFSVAA